MKNIINIALLLLLSYSSLGQDLDSIYVKFYKYSDALTTNKTIGKLDENVYGIAKQLNTLHPREFINKSIELLKEDKFNEASFIFYLGNMRWKYIENFTKYTDKDNKLKQDINDVINSFLRSNVNNFSAIINAAVKYHFANDYAFCSRKKNPLQYDEAAAFYNRMSNQFIINQDYFRAMWSKERRDFENDLKK